MRGVCAADPGLQSATPARGSAGPARSRPGAHDAALLYCVRRAAHALPRRQCPLRGDGVSLAVFALTRQWALGLVHAGQRDGPALHAAARALVAAAAPELTWTTVQAARGKASHHNTVDALHVAILAVMGVGAVVLIATNVPLARAVARHPAPGTDAALRLAAVLGLGLATVLGGAFGVALGVHGGHTAAALARWPVPSESVRRALVIGLAVAWAAGAVGAFTQARAGRAFPFG